MPKLIPTKVEQEQSRERGLGTICIWWKEVLPSREKTRGIPIWLQKTNKRPNSCGGVL